jgi:hypothetical protein
MHQIVGIDLNTRLFPSANYKEGEAHITKGWQTYGEAASTVSINQSIGQLFELFFRGFSNPLWLNLVSLALKLDVMMYNL